MYEPGGQVGSKKVMMRSNAPSSPLETTVDALKNQLADLSLMIKKTSRGMKQQPSAPSMNLPVHIASAQVMALIDAMRIRIGIRNALVAEHLVNRRQAVGLELVHRGEVAALVHPRRPKPVLPSRGTRLAPQGTR